MGGREMPSSQIKHTVDKRFVELFIAHIRSIRPDPAQPHWGGKTQDLKWPE